MATPLSADKQLEVYKASGIKNIHENKGWRTRGINRARTKGWSPRGVIIHQTAGNLGKRSVQQYMDDIINGDSAVPDKCNVAVAPDGTLWVNAAGRANHCLMYSSKALNAITSETFPLTGKYHDLRGSLQNMNLYTYGVEIIATSPNAAQIETAARWAAAICRAHGWSAGAVAGHGEVASNRDYSDPGIDMGKFRARVATLLKSKNPTNNHQEDDMPSVSDIWNGKIPFKAAKGHPRVTTGTLLNEAASQATYATNLAREAKASADAANVKLDKLIKMMEAK